MKIGHDVTNPQEYGWTLRELRAVEQEIGIFLDKPRTLPKKIQDKLGSGNSQQYGVYDEDEVYVGDVCADGRYFSRGELRQKIYALFDKAHTS